MATSSTTVNKEDAGQGKDTAQPSGASCHLNNERFAPGQQSTAWRPVGTQGRRGLSCTNHLPQVPSTLPVLALTPGPSSVAGSKVSVKLPHNKGLDNSMFLPARGGGVMRENVFLKKKTHSPSSKRFSNGGI